MNRAFTSLPYTEYSTTIYDDNRLPIKNIIIHSTVSTVQQAINTFSSPNATTSAHYIIGDDGKLWVGLEEYEVGYHSGNYAMNQKSIGIEHEWYSGMVISDALYLMSAKLVADICKFYKLPCNSTTIKPHKEIVATGCPNLIDVNRIINSASQILAGTNPTNPMDRRPYWFDLMNAVIWNKPWEQLTDNDVNMFVSSYPSQRTRSGLWDQIVNKAFGPTDSNTITVDQLYNKILTSGNQTIIDLQNQVIAKDKTISTLTTKLGQIKALAS